MTEPALRFHYDEALPITAHRDEIRKALEQHQVVVICGATGSGKTTQIPKLCLELGRGTKGLIGHTQPRRIAARAIAARLAAELGTTVGGVVGYQVRFTDRTSRQSRIKVMTDGILLKELERDRILRRYDTLIIDEAHERSLNIDFLFGVLKRLLPKRPDLKLIITSATIDPQRFAEFFGGAPVIEVSGRGYPVETRYRPLHGEDDDEESTVLSLPEGILEAVKELDADAKSRAGDILVFLPGEKQIREATDILEKAKLRNTEILPLYARLSASDQERIFARHTARRVVLSTNVAETSLTVPGIRYVIDSGLARISRYSVRGKVQRLPIEPISQASADQRLGRCGREAEGICIRLYAEEDFLQRPAFTPPEVLRTNLASVILQMAVLGLGEPEQFPFLDQPDTRLVNDGYRLLQELKAFDAERRVTSLGRQIASLPLDPRLARMLLAATHHGCLTEMLVVAAFLSGQDPRERPQESQAKADECHAKLADPRSDFITVLNLWRLFNEKLEELSGNQLRKWCRENYLSYLRLREWQDLHGQLSAAIEELKLKAAAQPAAYADLHQALLTGFLGSIGTLDERREYLGARGTRFVIAPGTALGSRTPQWVVSASMVETTKLYARMVAAVEPGWIESAGSHLLKRTYAEPHWVEERGFVAAFESITLYGLTLTSRRRVNYGNVAPREARDLFIREALVEGHSTLRAPFLEANHRLKGVVEGIEARIRRRDVLADEQAQCDFYAKRIPERVNSIPTFDRWWREVQPQTPQLLDMSLRDLMQREVPEASENLYPVTLDVGTNRLPLTYRFEPGAADDGVTLTVPLPLLGVLSAGQMGWLVPGMLLEKITALLRALPKALRKSFVPVPEHAAECLADLGARPQADFFESMAMWISRRGGQATTKDEVAALPLPDYLQMNFGVVDLEGKRLAAGRDLQQLRRQLRAGSVAPARQAAATSGLRREWDFGEVPAERQVERGGLTFTVYPALKDSGEGVELVELDSPLLAEHETRKGVLRLLLLALAQQLRFARKRFADRNELALLASVSLPDVRIADRLAERVILDAFLPDELATPRTRAQFDAAMAGGRDRFAQALDRLEARALEMLGELKTVRQKLRALGAPACKAAVADIEQQLGGLFPKDFLERTPQSRLTQYPRYLKALVRRLDRLPAGVTRDAELSHTVEPFIREWQGLRLAAGGPLRAQLLPELAMLRWMIEEFRVSLFAQDLRTAIPVSPQRMAAQLSKARLEATGS
ncbi:MAG: ATP-dependent RNA helicase HrpA [Steroidobacteraceae bacterium]